MEIYATVTLTHALVCHMYCYSWWMVLQ